MKKIMPIVFVVFIISACEKILFKKDLASTNPYDNFSYLWHEVDKKYSYFELKNIDWDTIKDKYEMKITSDMSEEALFKVLSEMLNELKDDHTNLVSPFNVSQYNIPLREKNNYNRRTIEEFYIPNYRITGSFIHDYIQNNEIGYIRYSSFMNTIDAASLDYVLLRYRFTKGLILDLRENGGGNIFNVPVLLERFSSQRTLAAYSVTRNGPGRNDFGKKEAFYINKHKGIIYTKPVVVLIDRGSYSATTFFALLTKVYPNITLIGDTTGGGGGLPNGGQLPNGWTYRFSVSQLLDLAGNNYAESGVPPDISATFDWTNLSKDEILEKAIEELSK